MGPSESTSALRELHDHARGTLLTDGVPTPSGYVVDRRTGLVVLAVTHGQATAEEVVLMIPGEVSPALQLLLEIDPGATVAAETEDRWMAYHGAPGGPLWTSWTILSARHGSEVVDGEALMTPSPLADEEPRLCAHANARREALARLARVSPGEAVCVGVDPFGMHVRTFAGVSRVGFATRGVDASQARTELDALLPSDPSG